jgi:hypothetical protein
VSRFSRKLGILDVSHADKPPLPATGKDLLSLLWRDIRVFEDMHGHFVERCIQIELIEVKKRILQEVKSAKYFAVIVDCTPYVSHKQKISIVSLM